MSETEESRAPLGTASRALHAAWDVAERGTCVVLNLLGPPGSGKTAAVDAWLEEVAPASMLRSWVPYETSATFRPLADVIELAADVAAADPVEVVKRKLSAFEGLDDSVRGRLAHVLGDPSTIYPNHEIFWGTQLFFSHLGDPTPLVVVWEGIERAEQTFLDMLEHIAGRPGRVLVVTTGRPEVLRSRPHWRSDEPAPLGSVLLDGEAELTSASKILDELDEMDRSTRLVVDSASLIGEAFDINALQAVVPPETSTDVAVAIDRLVQTGFLRFRHRTRERQSPTFEQGLVREAVREQVSDRFAAAGQERLATHLEKRGGGRGDLDEMIAFHLEFAIEHAKPNARKPLLNRAVNRLASAGRRALGRSDAPAAVDLLERGAVLIDEADTRRPRLLLSLCDGLLDLGDMQRIRRIADAGLQEAREVNDELAAARFGVWRQIAMTRLQPDETAIDSDEQVRVASLMEKAGEHLGAAEAYQQRAEYLWEQFDYSGAEEALETALGNARAAVHPRLESKIAAWLLFSLFWGPRSTTSGIARCESFSGEFSADRLLEANRLTTLGGLHGLAGDFDRSRALLLRGREIQIQLGQPLVISWNPQIGATVALLEGDLDEAEAEARLAFDEAQHLADPGHAATAASLLARILYRGDRIEEAFQYTRLAERASLGAPEAAQGEWRCTRALIDSTSGEHERALAAITGALDFLDGHAMPRDRADALVDLADVLRAGGRSEDERNALLQALELYEKKGVAPAVSKIKTRLDELS